MPLSKTTQPILIITTNEITTTKNLELPYTQCIALWNYRDSTNGAIHSEVRWTPYLFKVNKDRYDESS